MRTKTIVPGLVLLISVLLGSAICAKGQGAPGAPANINEMFMKVFEKMDSFTAKADIQVLDSSGKEYVKLPVGFTALDQKVRLDINMLEMQSKDLPPQTLEQLKTLGMQNIVNIMRPDKKANYIIYPEVKSYLVMPLTNSDGTNDLKVQKTALGKETLDGKSYDKHKVVVGNSEKVLFEATTWNDPALKDFPIQIRATDKENTMVMRFRNVQLTKPAASLFEIQPGMTEYKDPQSLMMGLAKKMMSEALGSEQK